MKCTQLFRALERAPGDFLTSDTPLRSQRSTVQVKHRSALRDSLARRELPIPEVNFCIRGMHNVLAPQHQLLQALHTLADVHH